LYAYRTHRNKKASSSTTTTQPGYYYYCRKKDNDSSSSRGLRQIIEIDEGDAFPTDFATLQGFGSSLLFFSFSLSAADDDVTYRVDMTIDATVA
jgi:hypothetical protein